MQNDIAKKGSLLGSTKSDYVAINYSGEKIMDVWVLSDQYVQSEGESDGWNFVDKNGDVIMLGGDVKIIRINDASTLAKYKEYHYEFDGGDYYDFLTGK